MEYGVRSTRAVSCTPLDKRNGMGWERGLVSQLLVFFFFFSFLLFLLLHSYVSRGYTYSWLHGCMLIYTAVYR